VLLAHEKAQQQLKETGSDIILSILQGENGEACLATTEQLYTGDTLYDIPIVRCRLLKDKKQQH
jgi:hypothetical protein